MDDDLREKVDEEELGAKIEDQVEQMPPVDDGEAADLLAVEANEPLETRAEAEHLEMQKRRKIPVWMVVVLALIGLVALGGAIWGVVSLMQGGNKGEQNGGLGGAVEGVESEDKTIPLELDNALVQRLYGNFQIVGNYDSDTLDFYTDEGVRTGNVNKELMAAIALRVSPILYTIGSCKGWEEYWPNNELSPEQAKCYSGEAVRQKIREIFGKEVEFQDKDWAGQYCSAYQYNAKNDEFYMPSAECGGICQYSVTRELEKAERDKDHVYLYEKAYGGDCKRICHTNGDLIHDDYNSETGELTEFDVDDYDDQIDRFKWTFTKSDDGDYVFTGLEQVK